MGRKGRTRFLIVLIQAEQKERKRRKRQREGEGGKDDIGRIDSGRRRLRRSGSSDAETKQSGNIQNFTQMTRNCYRRERDNDSHKDTHRQTDKRKQPHVLFDSFISFTLNRF